MTRKVRSRSLIGAMRGFWRHRVAGETRLVVELVYDDDSKNWSFRVPSLGIVGGAESKEEALTQAVDAVIFTLESEEPSAPNVEKAYLPVDVQPPKLVLAGNH